MWKQKNFPFLRMLRDNYVSFQKEKKDLVGSQTKGHGYVLSLYR